MKQSTTTAKWMLIVSMIIWGTLGLFTRQIGVSSSELALYRAVMATVLIGCFLLFRKERIDIAAVKREFVLLLLSGMVLGINWVLLFESYKHTTVSIATLSYYFAPVLVTVACPLFFRERLTAKQLLCFVMSTIGLVLIIGIGTGTGADGIGIAYGLGAAVFYAAVVLMNKSIHTVTGIQRTFLQFIGAIAILLPYVLLTDGITLHAVTPIGWGCLLAVGVFHTGIAYCLYFTAVKQLDGQRVAVLSYLDPLVAVLMSFTVLGETMAAPQLIGGALVLGFAIYNERN